jgi:hypothetical protein
MLRMEVLVDPMISILHRKKNTATMVEKKAIPRMGSHPAGAKANDNVPLKSPVTKRKRAAKRVVIGTGDEGRNLQYNPVAVKDVKSIQNDGTNQQQQAIGMDGGKRCAQHQGEAEKADDQGQHNASGDNLLVDEKREKGHQGGIKVKQQGCQGGGDIFDRRYI